MALSSLAQLPDLPALPAVAVQAAAIAEDPSSTASDLLRVILTDPPTASKVLRVAGALPLQRGPGPGDLQTAIVRLGFANVRNLLLGVSVMRSFGSSFAGAPYGREDFWAHSVSVGAAAARLASRGGQVCASTLFVAGLLHDLGKLVLDRYARDGFLHAVRLSQAEGIPLAEAERRRFGRDHAQVSGELLSVWRFPRELVEPVRWHHDPSGCDAAHRPHAVVLQAADWVCSAHGLGYSGNDHPVRPPAADLARLGLDDARLDQLLGELRSEPLLAALVPA